MNVALKAGTLLLKPLPQGWVLRPRRVEDIPAVVELMKRVYLQPHGPEAVWPAETLLEHARHFPEGQFSILTSQGRLVADATAMMVASAKALGPHRWSDRPSPRSSAWGSRCAGSCPSTSPIPRAETAPP